MTSAFWSIVAAYRELPLQSRSSHVVHDRPDRLPSALPSEGPDIQLLLVEFLQHTSASEAVLSSIGQALPFDGFLPGAGHALRLAPGGVPL
jgi:hypothetical protein